MVHLVTRTSCDDMQSMVPFDYSFRTWLASDHVGSDLG